MKRDADLVQAKRFDRLVQQHLAPLDRKAASAHRLGDIARRDRAVELSRVASLADRYERLASELARDPLRLALELEVTRLELHTLALEGLPVCLGRPQRLALRQQEVARITVPDFDHVAHL